MERIPMTNEAAAGSNPDTASQAMAGMRLGNSRGRQVSVWRESPGPRFSHPHEPGSRTARAGESPHAGTRQVAVVHSTARHGGAAAIARLYGEQDEPTRPQPPEPTPRAAAQPQWVAHRTGGETAARIARQPWQSSLELQHEDLTYQNFGFAGNFAADDLHQPTASSTTLPPSTPPKPVPRPRRHPHPVTPPASRETPVTAVSSPLDTSVRPPNLRRTHSHSRTTPGRETEHSHARTGPALVPLAPLSSRPLLPTLPPPQPRLYSLPVPQQTEKPLPVATNVRSSGPPVPPPMPQHNHGNAGATASPVSEPVYDEIPDTFSKPSPHPERRFLTPASRPDSEATNPVYAAPPPGPSWQSCDSAQEYRARALAHLATAGVDNPELELVRLYRRHVPGITQFDRQVQFAEGRYWEEMQNNAYVLAAFDLADGDRTRFHSMILPGLTEDQRCRMGREPYAQYSAMIKPFAGPSATEYLQSFEDQPLAIHEKVFKEAIQFARAHRARLGTGAPPPPPDATRV